MVGRATLTMVVSMMDMNMAATKTTLTATFSLTNPVVRGLPDSGRPATSACVFMVSFLGSGRRAGSALLGLPEDLADPLDLRQQFVRLGHVHAALGPRGPSELGGLVEQLVQLRVLLEVRRLEVVGPQHPEVVLDQLGALFLDEDRTGPELGVRVLRVLFRDGLDRFRLDPGLRRVIDSARQVAVGMDDGLRLEQACEQPHRFPFSGFCLQTRHYRYLSSESEAGSRWLDSPCLAARALAIPCGGGWPSRGGTRCPRYGSCPGFQRARLSSPRDSGRTRRRLGRPGCGRR